MSKIDLKTISKLESLSMLKMSSSEKEELLEDLNNLVGMIDKLSEVNTEGIAPLKHINNHEQELRNDIIKPSLDRDKVLNNAPHRSGNFFTVPKVIK